MYVDGALLFANGQTLVGIAAATPTASTNILDFSQPRDLGVSEPLGLFVLTPTVPASGTAGATITIALQGSPDGVTFTTLEDSGPVVIANISAQDPYLWRTQLPIFGSLSYRYLQLSYTLSAAFTAGTIEAGLVLDLNRRPNYPRNYAA